MRLQRLTGLERDKIEAEYAELQKLIAYYKARFWPTKRKVLGIIKDEILEIKRKYADERTHRDHRPWTAKSTCSTSSTRRTWWSP